MNLWGMSFAERHRRAGWAFGFRGHQFPPRSWGLVKFAWKYPSIFKILARGLGLLGSLIFLNYFFEVFNG